MRERLQFRGTASYVFLMIAMLSILGVLVVLTVQIGQVRISFVESYKILAHYLSGGVLISDPKLGSGPLRDIIIEIRAPRILLAVIVGAGLAIAGNVMQASIQNPLGDPYILGVSSGASLGATAALTF